MVLKCTCLDSHRSNIKHPDTYILACIQVSCLYATFVYVNVSYYYSCEYFMQVQTSLQQKYETERKELEQAHLKIVKQLEARCYEFDTEKKVPLCVD